MIVGHTTRILYDHASMVTVIDSSLRECLLHIIFVMPWDFFGG